MNRLSFFVVMNSAIPAMVKNAPNAMVVEFEIWETVNSSTIQEKNGKTEMKAFTRSSVANCINIKRASGYKDLMLLAFINKKERGFYKANEMY